MKINIKAIKKLMKLAYTSSTGLAVEGDNGGIAISGARWYVWINRENISFDMLALVVEYVGKIPEENEAMTVYKEQETQLRFLHSIELEKVKTADFSPENSIEFTNVFLEADNGKRYNAIKHDTGVKFVSEMYIDLAILENADEHIVMMDDCIACTDGIAYMAARTYEVQGPAAELLTQESW